MNSSLSINPSQTINFFDLMVIEKCEFPEFGLPECPLCFSESFITLRISGLKNHKVFYI